MIIPKSSYIAFGKTLFFLLEISHLTSKIPTTSIILCININFRSYLRHSFKDIHVSNLRKDLDLFFIRVFLAPWKDSNPDPDSWPSCGGKIWSVITVKGRKLLEPNTSSQCF